jgi:hypothetical protein
MFNHQLLSAAAPSVAATSPCGSISSVERQVLLTSVETGAE